MNIKDILSMDEQILYQGQQKRLVPSGKEWLPGKIAVTDQRIILESPIDLSNLWLTYRYHHINLDVVGNLTIINPAHMELNHIYHWYDGESNVVGSDFRIATGLHLHPHDIIYLTYLTQPFSSQLMTNMKGDNK
jgi:hypothetical protein